MIQIGDTVGYVIPEWPGQTHLWIWREVCHLRELGVTVRLFSTRRPPERDRARHAFADEAIGQTMYLWPIGAGKIARVLLASLLRSPIGFARCIGLAFTLPIEGRLRFKRLLPLLLPACYLAAEVRRDRIRHLHSHAPANSSILCMMVKRLTGVPFSQMVNANLEWWGGAMGEKFRDAAFTVACTNWMVEQMRRDHPDLDQATYGMCRVAVDVRKWTPLPRTPSPDGAVRLLTVSRLVPSKGQDDLLKAVAILKQRGQNVKLRIGGTGPESDNLQRLTNELGITPEVTFLGSLAEDQYLAEMRAADVFVLASHGEPMGVVYMEGMATEAAVVGTAAGGVGEIITGGVDGLLVPPKDPHALADGIETLIRDPALRQRLGRAGRRTILEKFDSRKWAAEMYRRIFGVMPPAPAPGPHPADEIRHAAGRVEALQSQPNQFDTVGTTAR
jgi:glycosyltransferase involved in cell wall biosynthesis